MSAHRTKTLHRAKLLDKCSPYPPFVHRKQHSDSTDRFYVLLYVDQQVDELPFKICTDFHDASQNVFDSSPVYTTTLVSENNKIFYQLWLSFGWRDSVLGGLKNAKKGETTLQSGKLKNAPPTGASHQGADDTGVPWLGHSQRTLKLVEFFHLKTKQTFI